MEKELLALCEDFVKHHKVRAPESPYQMDGIQEAAPELIEAICNIVGYYDDDTDSLDRSKYGDPRTPEFGVGGDA